MKVVPATPTTWPLPRRERRKLTGKHATVGCGLCGNRLDRQADVVIFGNATSHRGCAQQHTQRWEAEREVVRRENVEALGLAVIDQRDALWTPQTDKGPNPMKTMMAPPGAR